MGACSEMRLPRSLSLSQSMSFSGALDSLAAAAAPAPARPAAGQSSSTSTEDRCFAGFALSGVKSYGGGPSSWLELRGTAVVRRARRGGGLEPAPREAAADVWPQGGRARKHCGRERERGSETHLKASGLFWLSPRRSTWSRAASRQLPFRYASPATRSA